MISIGFIKLKPKDKDDKRIHIIMKYRQTIETLVCEYSFHSLIFMISVWEFKTDAVFITRPGSILTYLG